MSKQWFVHKKDGSIYGFNKITAELITEGHEENLIIVEDDDPRVRAYFAKMAKGKEQPKAVPAKEGRSAVSKRHHTEELPASALETHKA